MGAMESSAVPNHHRMFVLRERAGELIEKQVDHLRIEAWAQQPFGLPRFRAHRTDHPQIVVLSLANRTGAGTGGGPHPGERTLLAEAGFILKEDSQLLVGLLLGYRLDPLRELFLNTSWAAGSARRCWGRGTREE